jgi:hypothetical protein
MKTLSMSALVLLTLTAIAYPDQPLSKILVDLPNKSLTEIKEVAVEQATTSPKYKSNVARRGYNSRTTSKTGWAVTFEGSYQATDDHLGLAIFSDDGSTVSIKGPNDSDYKTLHQRFKRGQHLGNIPGITAAQAARCKPVKGPGNSFYPLNYEMKKGETYQIRVQYGNLFLISDTDLDGCSLFVYQKGYVQLVQVDDNSPIAPKHRMCSNAQEEYKQVSYRVTVTPNHRRAHLQVSGTAGVTFADNGETAKNSVRGNTVIDLLARDGSDGTWELVATCADDPSCTGTAGENVFKFAFHVDPQPVTKNPVRIAPDMGSDYTRYLTDYGLGNAAELSYKKMSIVRSSLDFEWAFRVRTRFSHSLQTGQLVQYGGRSEHPSFWPEVQKSKEWKALRVLVSIVSGPAIKTVASVIDFAMGQADNSNQQYTAMGCGKPTFDVSGKARGKGTDHKRTATPVDLAQIDDFCWPESTVSIPANPSKLPSWGPPTIIHTLHTVADTGPSRVDVEEVYDHGVSRDINAGYVFEFNTSATYGWHYEGYSIPWNLFHAGGINVISPKVKLWDWAITPSGRFEILPLIP